jgi:phage baseplate assembly protein W
MMTAKVVSQIAISLPFSISAYGRVTDTRSQEKIWADKVRSAVGTLVSERVMRPRFGSTVPLTVFDNQFNETAGNLKEAIQKTFAEYLDLLTLDAIDITFDELEGAISAEIIYSLPNEGSTTVNIALATTSRNAALTEETL